MIFKSEHKNVDQNENVVEFKFIREITTHYTNHELLTYLFCFSFYINNQGQIIKKNK